MTFTNENREIIGAGKSETAYLFCAGICQSVVGTRVRTNVCIEFPTEENTKATTKISTQDVPRTSEDFNKEKCISGVK